MSITKFPFSYVLFGIAAVKVMRFSQEHNTMTGQTPLLRHIQSFIPPLHVGLQDGRETLAINNVEWGRRVKESQISCSGEVSYV